MRKAIIWSKFVHPWKGVIWSKMDQKLFLECHGSGWICEKALSRKEVARQVKEFKKMILQYLIA